MIKRFKNWLKLKGPYRFLMDRMVDEASLAVRKEVFDPDSNIWCFKCDGLHRTKNCPEDIPLDLALIRHQLGSVDLSDVKEEDMSESERLEYNSVISAVFPRLEKDIKRFLHYQLMFISNEANTWERVIFGRGTFNGMDILLDSWKRAHLEHTERLKPKERFDESNPIGEFNE